VVVFIGIFNEIVHEIGQIWLPKQVKYMKFVDDVTFL